jgi:hypothetical protein
VSEEMNKPIHHISWKMILILLFFGLNFLQTGCSYSAFAERGNGRELLNDLIWTEDSKDLYFSLSQSRPAEHPRNDDGRYPYKKKIMKHDFSINETRMLHVGPAFASPTINNCREIFAPTVLDPESDICIISEIENRLYDLREINQVGIYGAWLECSEVVFHGCGPHSCGVFLWNKDSNELTPINLFEDRSLDEIPIVYSYHRFEPSFVRRRVIFGYSETRLHGQETQDTYNLGAIDLETGKVWKIVELENFNELFRWFSSDTEDATYFFKWEESGCLASLWTIRSDGTDMRKVLDSKAVSQAHYQNTLVSWSGNGETFAIKYGCSEKEFKVINARTGEVKNLGVKADNSSFFALSPDGKKLAYVYESELYVFSLDTGIEQMIFSLNDIQKGKPS